MSQIFTSFLTLKRGILLIAFIAFANLNFAYSQNCSAKLSVEKDRNVKSVYKNGATYNMVLTNTSSTNTTYYISTKNLKEACSTENRKSSAPNVTLNVEVQGGDAKKMGGSSITLAAGQTGAFKIFITIPPNTPYDTWSCIEVEATGESCNSAADSTILRVFVPEPSDG